MRFACSHTLEELLKKNDAMPFWSRKKEEKIIQCSVCEWNPDGGKHWSCSCGYLWNTFETKGKCPKCKTQWEDTRCISCGQSTPHQDWYKTKEDLARIEKNGNPILRAKKKSLESRLINYGIRNSRVSYLPYLDHTNEKFQTAFDAGCRMIILYAVSYAVHNLEKRPQIIAWLKAENIWEKVSENEKDFFNNPSPAEDLLMDLSWQIEAALTLGWCLKKVEQLPSLEIEHNEKEIAAFQNKLPAIGDNLTLFLSNMEYRDKNEIYEENLLNELVTTYFRNLLFNGKEDETQINRFISFERHKTLNWLRTFMESEDWDEIDTST